MSDQLVEKPMEETPELSNSAATEEVKQAAEPTSAEASEAEAPVAAEAASAAAPEAATAEAGKAESSESPVESSSSETGDEAASSEVASPEATSAETTAPEAASPEAASLEAKSKEETKDESSAEESSAEAEAPTVGATDAAADTAAADTAAADATQASSDETSEQKAQADAEPAKAEAPAAEASTDGSSASTSGAKVVDGTKPAEANSAEMIALKKALEDEALVEGQVIGWNKGGYHVALGKIAAFCPVSQIEIGNPRAPKRYLDKTFKFRVIEIQDGGRRVVISRSAALEAERTAKAEEVRGKLVKGAVLEGRVSSLTDFGAFVNLGGGVEGLVHISEISRRRVEHPKDALKHRQKVKVSILKIEEGGNRISLSMKALEADPWKGVADRFESGAEFEGTILRRTDFGFFVEVEPGLEGLVHVSRLPISIEADDESLAVGQSIKGWVHEVDAKRRRLSLSLREVTSNDPWKGIEERFREGEVILGKVERIAKFGAFVELEPGLTGLLSFSAVNTAPNANLRKQFHPGREIKIRILSIDKGRRRISLGTELSKAEGSQQDYREYLKQQKKEGGSLNAMAAAFAKLKDR